MLRTTVLKLLTTSLILLTLIGCAANPVTGKQELSLISERSELEIGKKNYAPTRQQQGGDYTVDPALAAYVSEVGQRVAKVADRKLDYEFKIINDSTPNAWAMPGGKIAVNRGLLVELESEAELAAVLGHEVVHAAARHGAQSMERGMLLQGALFAANVALSGSEYRSLGVLGANIGALLTKQKYGRDAEREADHYGINYMVRAGYDPSAAVSLQETFVRLAEGKKSNWLEGLLASHPPSPERVRNNRKLLASLDVKGGEIARERYQKMTARLRRNQPAYEAYKEAEKALEAGDTNKALQLVNKALKIEPKEALFHGLRGDIRQDQKRNKDALINYNRALNLNPGYFRFPLMRGLVKQQIGDTQGAQIDLQRSVELLPTAEGYLGLGMVAQLSGNPDLAINHYRKASESSSKSGKRAAIQLAKLDLENNPDSYISAQLQQNKQGGLLIQVKNNSPLKVNNIRVVLGVKTGRAVHEKAAYRLSRTLNPGQSILLDTNSGPVEAATARSMVGIVSSARIAE